MSPALLPLPIALAEQALRSVVDQAGEFARSHDAEVTKRHAADLEREVALERIRAQQGVVLEYLRASFAEREQNFAELFERLDASLANDGAQVEVLLGAIVTLAKSTPLAGIADLEAARAAWADPEVEW